jgi:sulfite reductase (NADPH) flavoprotein alpha-component
VLTSGRVKNQWHTMTRTGKSASLLKDCPAPYIELNPQDAERWQIGDGELVKVSSRRGKVIVPAQVTSKIRAGTCFMPFHWGRLAGHDKAVNNITTGAVDPVSRQPELKACAVSICPVIAMHIESSEAQETVMADFSLQETYLWQSTSR